MERWTRAVIANRKKVLVAWLVLFVLGGYGASHLGDLLTNRFKRSRLRCRTRAQPAQGPLQRARRRRLHAGLPEQAADRGLAPAAAAAGGRPRVLLPAFRREASKATVQAASAVQGARPGPVLYASPRVAYVQINTPLENQDAAKKTPDIRAATPTLPGVTTYLSGFPAINHDTQKIYNEDLDQGRDDRDPDRADRDGLHVRHARRDRGPLRLRRGDDPLDPGRGLGRRPLHGHGDLRDQHRHPDRPGDRDRLLDARRLPLSRRAGETRLRPRGAGRNDEDGRSRDALLRRGRGGRPGPAGLHAGAVHALDGRRRAARAALLDPRLGDLPAGAAGGDGDQGQQIARDPAQHPRAPRAAGEPASGAVSRARSCAGRFSTWSSPAG